MRAHEPGRRPLWVAEVDGEVAGWFSFEPFRERPAYHATAEVSVYVAEGRRREGIGRRLLAEAIRRAPGCGLKTLTAGPFGHNGPSLALFEEFGFERRAYTRGWRSSTSSNATSSSSASDPTEEKREQSKAGKKAEMLTS